MERAKEEEGLTEAMRARICDRYADEEVVGQGEPKAKSRPLLPITNSSNRDKKQAAGRREVREITVVVLGSGNGGVMFLF